jgi:hypothetical protein
MNKNPLKDLDQFLKQQASTLIHPPSLSEKVQPADASRISGLYFFA